jgi:hypothetical protein
MIRSQFEMWRKLNSRVLPKQKHLLKKINDIILLNKILESLKKG